MEYFEASFFQVRECETSCLNVYPVSSIIYSGFRLFIDHFWWFTISIGKAVIENLPDFVVNDVVSNLKLTEYQNLLQTYLIIASSPTPSLFSF